jgi:hypothetical protein
MIRENAPRCVCDRCGTELRFDAPPNYELPADWIRQQAKERGWTSRDAEGATRDLCYACTVEERK